MQNSHLVTIPRNETKWNININEADMVYQLLNSLA